MLKKISKVIIYILLIGVSLSLCANENKSNTETVSYGNFVFVNDITKSTLNLYYKRFEEGDEIISFSNKQNVDLGEMIVSVYVYDNGSIIGSLIDESTDLSSSTLFFADGITGRYKIIEEVSNFDYEILAIETNASNVFILKKERHRTDEMYNNVLYNMNNKGVSLNNLPFITDWWIDFPSISKSKSGLYVLACEDIQRVEKYELDLLKNSIIKVSRDFFQYDYGDSNFVFLVPGYFIDTAMKSFINGVFDYENNSIQVSARITDRRFMIFDQNNIPQYSTLAFTEEKNINNSPLKNIGIEIKVGDILNGYNYGYIADINGNGIDEIYLFQLTNFGFFPLFYEYNQREKKFMPIITYEIGNYGLSLESIDTESKQLKFHKHGMGISEEVIYSWNGNTRKYEITKQASLNDVNWEYGASSYLVETNAVYSAKNLSEYEGLPWASGNGAGIGDIITIKLNGKIPEQLAIYNGFQSDEKPYLYAQNSRVKKIRITNDGVKGESIVYTLKDSAEKQIIDVSKLLVSNETETTFEIEILEVYLGNKYEDLCIQAILPYADLTTLK